MIHFDGEFRVPGTPTEVLARFADVPRMAQCMPGASIDGRDEDGRYLGSMLVAFGPKKIKFKGKVDATTDAQALSGGLHVRGAADMKVTARADVRVAYSLRSDPDATGPTTIVALSSDAEMTGALAGFAQTGGAVVTRALMQEFAQRAAAEFARDLPATADTDNASADPERAPPAALSAPRFLWHILKAKLASIFALRH